MINQKPLVSIIIPAYNAETFVAEAIQSALAQTYDNIEIIVVDDGSTDNTYNIIRAFESVKVHIFHQTNMGACVARNRGFDESHGEYVKFFDADDILYPNAIEKQLAHALALSENQISVSSLRYSNGDIIHYKKYRSFGECISGGLQTTVPLFRRSVIIDVHGFDIHLNSSQDYDLGIECYLKGYQLCPMREVLFDYRYGINNESISLKLALSSDILYLYNKYKSHFEHDVKARKFFVERMFSDKKSFDNHGAFIRFVHQIAPFGYYHRIDNSRTIGFLYWYLSNLFPSAKFYNQVRKFSQWLTGLRKGIKK